MRAIANWCLAACLLLAGALLSGEIRSEEPARREKWADARMPVTQGLALWLDAATIDGARAATGKPPLKDGDPIVQWPDASGHGRHFSQAALTAQPTWWPTGSFRAVRFDGRGDYLALEELGLSYDEVTLFVVAAPYSSPEWFSALLAMSADGKNDFESGINIDQGVSGGQQFDVLNVEGTGTAGMRNLLKKPEPYGSVLRLCVSSATGKDGIQLWVSGEAQGSRERAEGSTIRADRTFLGARSFNLGAAPQVRGFLEGDVAEVIVFDRILLHEERVSVERYLADKYAGVGPLPIPGTGTGKPLVRVSPSLPVQMLLPGFRVRELPVDLTNVNNLLYRPDGKLVALGYDGNVWLLTDSDGDGLEDKASQFWENNGVIRAPIGMALTPPGYKHGSGVFVAGKGKVSLLADTDGDDKADKETVVADGWKELPHGVDALGVAVDREGAVCFGLGTTNFTNAYLVEAGGKAGYDVKSERGTIIRVAPDFKSREIVATGIRFPVGMRFNAAGDLFATDQEGATWLANGNPLDELLHVERGRHYGFPPRHPKHLPNVIDEPSTFDYGPQHQSLCGLNFNESATGGPVFGPSWWQSDVLVAGYSRGKLYRTKLVKTAEDYVAQNQLIACLNMLAADACVSPAGDLVVACHSGGPDWGSGPSGKGKLYKVAYSQPELPQPVQAWAQSPREVRIAFDRPLEADQLARLSKTSIEYGRYVSAGDRFESLWPGYQATQDQLRTPRFELPVHSVQVTPDRRTLILATATHPEAVNYAITLPGLGRDEHNDDKSRGLPQAAEVDLRYDLCGVELAWQAKDGEKQWSGWAPHLDLAVAQSLMNRTTDHEELQSALRTSGQLTLRTALNLKDMLRPAVQPGSQIDYVWPKEQVTLTIRSSVAFDVKVDGIAQSPVHGDAGYSTSFAVEGGSRVPVELVLGTGGVEPTLQVSWHTAEDARPRSLPLHRMLLSWAPEERAAQAELVEAEVPELKGGNWGRGRQVFFSEAAGCAKCHTVNRRGATIGPDLSNLPHRDYHSVLRDITQPSFAINPDYISQVALLTDGRVLTGAVRTVGDKLSIGDAEGRITTVSREEIDELQPSKLSVMPEGLLKKLSAEQTRDLLTFLLSKPPRMPDYGKAEPPPPRKAAEVEAILAGAPEKVASPKQLKLVLVTGRKDHGPGEHDYPAWQKAWSQLLSMADNTIVETADNWPSKEQLKSSDVLIFYQQGTWNAERAQDLDAFFKRGGGAVYIHYAVDGGGDAAGFAERIGLAWKGGASKFRHGELDLDFQLSAGHPIARNFERLHLHDESYWQLVGDPKRTTLLATGKEDGKDQPLFWTREQEKGRVFVSIPGHFSWSFDDPLFRIVLLRGIAWAAGEPVDRFNELVLPGARLE